MRVGVLVVDEILGTGDEILPGIWLGRLESGLVPRFAILAAAAHVGYGLHTAALIPSTPGRIGARRRAHAVGAVTGDLREIVAVQLQSFLVDDR